MARPASAIPARLPPSTKGSAHAHQQRPHKFAVGQSVVFAPGLAERNIPGGSYVITRPLPGDDFDRTYRARSTVDGHERVLREPQLLADNPWKIS